MKIAVTTFYTKSYEPLAAITVPVLQKYCDKHGYDLYINKTEDGDFHFVKTKDARRLLDSGYSGVWAVENDILITNLSKKIENNFRYGKYFSLSNDINGINGGSFLIKNGDWSQAFLDFINSFEKIVEDEQTVMQQYCDSELFKSFIDILPHPSLNSIPYDPYYAPSYGRYNYKEGDISIKPTHEQGCWEVGDFAMHLPGLTMGKRIEIFSNHLKDIVW